MTTTLQSSLAELARLIELSQAVVGFTGAGISTECGVPDFRTPGSPWMRNKPIPFDAFVASDDARREAWRRKFVMDDSFAGARPGRGHAAMASMVTDRRMLGIITQNIDNLHQDSGVAPEKIVELHGNGTYATCLACGRRRELAEIRPAFEATGEPPRCTDCGGWVKSATISFGQRMPEAQMRRARHLALAADLFLVAGSSLVVFPAASLPLLAKSNGARLAIINREPTGLDEVADLVIRDDIGSVLEPFIARGDARQLMR